MITSIYPGNSVTPKKSDQCAIVIPAYQSNLSELEKICLDISARSLSKWDSYFVCPDDLNLDLYQEKYGIRQGFFS
jgi:hypothetical protein